MNATYVIEYEIPPLRAIYFCEVEAVNEEDARVTIAKQHPNWKIRKISEKHET